MCVTDIWKMLKTLLIVTKGKTRTQLLKSMNYDGKSIQIFTYVQPRMSAFEIKACVKPTKSHKKMIQ